MNRNTQLIQDEILNDPESLGYAGKTAQEVLTLLTSATRSTPRGRVDTDVLINNTIDVTEYLALDEAQLEKFKDWMATFPMQDPAAAGVQMAYVLYFGLESQTVANLVAFQNVACTRIEELGLTTPSLYHIQQALGEVD